jgi:hypothetical protein
MVLRRLARIALACALVASACFGGASPAAARPELEPLQAQRLAEGGTVTFEQTIDNQAHRYVGGVTYTVVEAAPTELAALFEDVHAYKQLLPHTKEARLVGVNGRDRYVELRQGNSLVNTSYTMRIRTDDDGKTVRFWLDPSKPHGIADAWGFFRVEALPETTPGTPRVLLTYGALVDVGPGIVRELFEERLRAVMLTVPQLVRRYALTHLRTRGRA